MRNPNAPKAPVTSTLSPFAQRCAVECAKFKTDKLNDEQLSKLRATIAKERLADATEKMQGKVITHAAKYVRVNLLTGTANVAVNYRGKATQLETSIHIARTIASHKRALAKLKQGSEEFKLLSSVIRALGKKRSSL